MMVCKLTGLRYCQWKQVRESIGVKNLVTLEREPKYDKPGGLAYRASYGGFTIGYIPLVSTIEGYWHDAKTEEDKNRIAEWGRAAKKVRKWLDSRTKYQHETSWMVPVWEILFKDENGNYNTKDIGEAEQISLAFEEVE